MNLKAKLVKIIVDEVIQVVKNEMIEYYRGTEIEPAAEYDLFKNIEIELTQRLYY